MLKTIWTNIGIYAATILWTIDGLLISPFAFAWCKYGKGLTTAEATRKLIWLYGRAWVRLVSLFVPVKTAQAIPPKPCIVVANHASFFDMYFVGAQPEWNLCIAVRDWPFKIPFYRPFMEAAGYIKTENQPLDDILKQSQAALESGATLFFYPEGTRTHDGTLSRFRSGAFHIALQTGVPVVPLCLSGTHELLPRGKWKITPSEVEVRLLPPVYPDTYQQVANGHVLMRKEVQSRMAQALQEMAGNHESSSRS